MSAAETNASSTVFTPTTRNIEDSYAYDERYEFEHPDDAGHHYRNRAAFKRWLYDHDSAVRAAALDEAAEVAERRLLPALTASEREYATASIASAIRALKEEKK